MMSSGPCGSCREFDYGATNDGLFQPFSSVLCVMSVTCRPLYTAADDSPYDDIVRSYFSIEFNSIPKKKIRINFHSKKKKKYYFSCELLVVIRNALVSQVFPFSSFIYGSLSRKSRCCSLLRPVGRPLRLGGRPLHDSGKTTTYQKTKK